MREFKTNIETEIALTLALTGGEFGEPRFPAEALAGYREGALVGVYKTGDDFSLRARDPQKPPRFGLGS